MSNEIVLELIETNLLRLMADEFYNGLELIVSKERVSDVSREVKKNRIYVVVQFLESGITAGHTIQPIQLLALTEHNNIVKVEALLRSFAEIYNSKVTDSGITQYYLTPVMISAFNEVYDGYRGVYALNGTLLIAPANANALKNVEVWNGSEWESIELLSSVVSLTVQLSPDTYINSGGKTRAHPIQKTLTVNLVFYLTNNYLCNKCIDMAFDSNFIKFKFNFEYKFTIYEDIALELAEFTQNNQLGQLPIISVTLTGGV